MQQREERHADAIEGTWTCLVAALCSEDWQKRKRSSFRPLVKTYLPDMADWYVGGGLGGEGIKRVQQEKESIIHEPRDSLRQRRVPLCWIRTSVYEIT